MRSLELNVCIISKGFRLIVRFLWLVVEVIKFGLKFTNRCMKESECKVFLCSQKFFTLEEVQVEVPDHSILHVCIFDVLCVPFSFPCHLKPYIPIICSISTLFIPTIIFQCIMHVTKFISFLHASNHYDYFVFFMVTKL